MSRTTRKAERRQDRGQVSGGQSSDGARGGDEIIDRDPVVTNRDPERRQHKPRHYIPAAMPVVCPKCGHATRMDDGRHVDPVRKMILEYRTCCWCGHKVAAGRGMTVVESGTLCSRADAVAEYEQSR